MFKRLGTKKVRKIRYLLALNATLYGPITFLVMPRHFLLGILFAVMTLTCLSLEFVLNPEKRRLFGLG